jgi:Tetratricopeptide repeat
MNARAMAINDTQKNRLEEKTNAGIKAALDRLQQKQLGDALVIFGYVFKDGIGLPAERVASVLIEVADTLITVFEFDNPDGRAPAAYHFLETVGREAAGVIAGLLELANFSKKDEDPAALSEPIMLAYAGALSAAGRHDEAIDILARLLDKSPDRQRLRYAMFVAQRRKYGLSDT